MSNFEKFIKTCRYDKPHGILLLFYPCIWGLYLTNQNIANISFLCIIFFIGACGMRSLGCIWNDLKDKKFDKKVERTKYRLIAQDKLTKVQIITYIIINSLVGICPLLFIPFKAVVVALCVIPLIIIYPFMKRITWWPQLWLGITFNWGVFVGYNSINNNFISLEMLAMYLACVFWTLAYDTVYGFQDIIDDRKIGIKSTSIKFKNNPKLFLVICYLISFIFLIFSFLSIKANPFILGVILMLYLIILLRVNIINLNSGIQCQRFFIFNSYCGLFITLTLIIF